MHNSNKKRKYKYNNDSSQGKFQNMKLTLMYDGSNYQGWQRLKTTSHTIQGTLEKIISAEFNQDIKVIGSGRTDVGVHALGQVANFRMLTNRAKQISCDQIKRDLNQKLPEDIKIIALEMAADEFHSRYNVRSKTYEYHIEIGERPSVFSRKYVTHIKKNLDLNQMKRACQFLKGTHDFIGFSSNMTDGRGTVKTVHEITIESDNGHVVIGIQADGFLYHMVRIIVGTLVEIGLNQRECESIISVFESKDRKLAGYTIESQGLFLKKVEYHRN